MELNKQDILNFIPHRDPFLFIDEVSHVSFPTESIDFGNLSNSKKELIGGKVIAHFDVKDELDVLRGHFPGNPILPGVVQLEMMAQASVFLNSKLVESKDKFSDVELDIALLGVDKARFRKPVVPGMRLDVHSELVKARGHYLTYKVEIFCEEEPVANAEIFAFFKIIQGEK